MPGGRWLTRASAVFATVLKAFLTNAILCGQNEKFLNTGGPLVIGVGTVFLSMLGNSSLPN